MNQNNKITGYTINLVNHALQINPKPDRQIQSNQQKRKTNVNIYFFFFFFDPISFRQDSPKRS